MENTGYDTYLFTCSGKFHPLAPRVEEVNFVDIARSLANTARWNGHTCGLFSVAEHSILVSRQCPPELELWGLLHDAAEAYIGDIPAPMKSMLRFEVPVENGSHTWTFADVEQNILDAILVAAGIPIGPIPEIVHSIDMAVRNWEFAHVMDSDPPNLNHPKHVPMTPNEAMMAWLLRFESLTAGKAA